MNSKTLQSSKVKDGEPERYKDSACHKFLAQVITNEVERFPQVDILES